MKVKLCIYYEPGFPEELHIMNSNRSNMIYLDMPQESKLSEFIEGELVHEFDLNIDKFPREYKLTQLHNYLLVELNIFPVIV